MNANVPGAIPGFTFGYPVVLYRSVAGFGLVPIKINGSLS
jgi:hypothetical protein